MAAPADANWSGPTTASVRRPAGLLRWARQAAPPSRAGAVSLDQLLDAHWRWKRAVERAADGDGPPDGRAQSTGAEYERLLARFEGGHRAEVVDHFFGSRVKSAALLTSDDRVRIRYPAEAVAGVQPEFEEAVWRTIALAERGRVLFDSGSTSNRRARTLLAEGLHSVVVYLLGVLDSLSVELSTVAGDGRLTDRVVVPNGDADAGGSGPVGRVHKAIDAANRELDRLDRAMHQLADRAALKYYLLGLPFGVLGLYLLARAVGGMQLAVAGSEPIDMQPLVVTLVAGGVGALISVMTRVSNGELNVSHTSSRPITLLAGAFRPVIGAVFGVALYVLLQAGLLPFVQAPDDQAGMFFFAGVGFLAGFSERWAQDQIVETTGVAGRAHTPAGLSARRPAARPTRSDAERAAGDGA